MAPAVPSITARTAMSVFIAVQLASGGGSLAVLILDGGYYAGGIHGALLMPSVALGVLSVWIKNLPCLIAYFVLSALWFLWAFLHIFIAMGVLSPFSDSDLKAKMLGSSLRQYYDVPGTSAPVFLYLIPALEGLLMLFSAFSIVSGVILRPQLLGDFYEEEEVYDDMNGGSASFSPGGFGGSSAGFSANAGKDVYGGDGGFGASLKPGNGTFQNNSNNNSFGRSTNDSPNLAPSGSQFNGGGGAFGTGGSGGRISPGGNTGRNNYGGSNSNNNSSNFNNNNFAYSASATPGLTSGKEDLYYDDMNSSRMDISGASSAKANSSKEPKVRCRTCQDKMPLSLSSQHNCPGPGMAAANLARNSKKRKNSTPQVGNAGPTSASSSHYGDLPMMGGSGGGAGGGGGGGFGSGGRSGGGAVRAGMRVRVHRRYIPQLKDELAIEVDDIVEVEDVFEDGWGTGTNLSSGAYGAFPCSNTTSGGGSPLGRQASLRR